MSKVLVSYFSATGKTKKMAESISNKINGDLFEIEPITFYSQEDLDWTNSDSRSSVEMADKDFRAPIERKVENIEEYDKVVIGFPIWWSIAPSIVKTFIEENDLLNKSIYLFYTSGENTAFNCLDDLKETYNTLSFKASKRIGNDEDIEAFIKMVSE
jgi:flavodoxin